MMLVKKYPSIINMTIKIDKASLGAASDAGDVQGLHKGRLGIGEKTVEGQNFATNIKQSPEQGRLWKWMRATRTSSKV
jgi:hypothetical protein